MMKDLIQIAATISSFARRLVGGYGTYFFSDNAAHTARFAVITPTEDTVIAELYVNGVDVLATANTNRKYNFDARTLTIADLITCESGKEFTGIKLTSGAVRCN